MQTHRPSLPASTWMTVLVGISCLLMAISRSFSSLTWATVVLVVAPAGLLILQILIGRQYGDRPPAALAAGAIAAQLGMIELISQLDGQSIASLLYFVLPFPAVFWLGARAGLIVSAVVLSLFTVRFAAAKPLWRTDSDVLHSYMLFAIALVLVTTTAVLVRRERTSREQAERLLRDLSASHRQLVESQGRVAELATIEERNRLARDIHDSLGHYLTVVSVQLEKAQVLVAEDPAAASAAVANAKRLADQALSDVRESVGALRRDEAPFLLEPTLRSMVEDLRVLPFDLSLQVTGDEQHYSRQQLLALYRAVQEGLTNVQRHARASRARVVVELTEATASVTVDDDGIGPPAGAGDGLRGVRERLELVSGRLVLTNAPGGGTRMAVTIPRTRVWKALADGDQ
ncbi:sensor histidine kinase [Kribbella antibiotica]|uniref:histidine kinase n=1 Tax=Kribbella antibiotica TaxID=190195 RepID=A0A4R4ZXB6_9ACTN|nr:sensor histidine kinase [Kribbella antibiotica]TDD63006.1 sensor histidine kinase [Kribbella antibiotica]